MTDKTLEDIQNAATPKNVLAEAKTKKQQLERKISTIKNRIKEIQKSSVLTDDEKLAKIAEEEQMIADTMEIIDNLDAEISRLSKLKQKQVNQSVKAESGDFDDDPKIIDALATVKQWISKQPSACYVIEDGKFGYITDYSTVVEKQNIQFRTMDPNKFIEELAADLHLKTWHIPPHRLKDLYNECNRTYKLCRYSLDSKNWASKDTYLPLQHMTPYFIDKLAETVGDDYHPAFDWLMYSLSGASKENQDHIEQWILHKVINYDKAITTPDIVIVGHVGGNGKGILQSIIRMMFPAMLSGKANSKTLNGNFNAILVGKLIVFFDDQNSKEIPLEVVKQMAGSDTIIIELKGKDQYEGEKTNSSAWFSNVLPFPLTPGGQEGGVDRRFSIMRTNITFLESIRHHFKNDDGSMISVEESKDYAEVVVSKVLMNRVEIAKWFNALQQKHPQVNRDFLLKAHHGADYQYFLKMQLGSMETVWNELVMPTVKAGGCVPIFAIKEVLRHLEGKVIGDKAITTKMKELASQNRVDVEFDRASILIEPNRNNTTTKKQCAVIRPKDNAKWVDHTFNWDLISNAPYHVAPGKELVEEDNFIFGCAKDDEPDELLEEDMNLVEMSVATDEVEDEEAPIIVPVVHQRSITEFMAGLKNRQ